MVPRPARQDLDGPDEGPGASARGSYAGYTPVLASRVVARPAGLGITVAAAVWVAYSTAYGALVEKAGIRPGDRVVVTVVAPPPASD